MTSITTTTTIASATPSEQQCGKSRTVAAYGFLTSQLIALTAGLVLQSFAARNLSPQDYGRFAVSHTIILVLTHFLCGMLPKAAARQISIRSDQLRAVCGLLIRLHVPVCVGTSTLLWLLRDWIGNVFADAGMVPLVSLISLIVILHCGLVEPCWNLLNGLRLHRAQALMIVAHGVLRCAAVCWFVWTQSTAAGALTGLLIATGLSLILVLPTLLALVSGAASRDADAGLKTRQLLDWVRYSSLVDVVWYASCAFSLWTVKAIVTDAEAVAVYAATFALAQINLALCRAVSRGYFAHFAVAREAGNRPECMELLRSASQLLLIGITLELVLAIVVGDQFVEWFSRMTLTTRGLPFLLMLGTAMLGTCCLFSELLAAAGELRLRFAAAVLYGITCVGSGLFVVRLFGILGAAVAFCLAGVLTLTVLFIRCQKIYGRWSVFPSAVRCFAAGSVSVLWAFLPATSSGISGLAGKSVPVIATFLGALFLLREFPNLKQAGIAPTRARSGDG